MTASAGVLLGPNGPQYARPMLRDHLRGTRARAVARRYASRFADVVADRVALRLDTPPGLDTPPAVPAPRAIGVGDFALAIDFPVSPRTRYGFGRPSHPALAALLSAGAGR